MDLAVTLSIILPVLNEAALIAPLLDDLRQRFAGVELIVVDGGSTDQTANRARALADRYIGSAPGRAVQMNAGARVARGDCLVFLHADTRLPDAAHTAILRALAATPRIWGRFDVRISGNHPMLPVIAALMNLRSRLTGVATGDQAIFVTRAAFDAAGGFPEIALMEDIALSKRLRRISPPVCLRDRVVTSGRRWEANGVLRTILIMWALRLGYMLGVPPARLGRVWSRMRRR
ncbi:rSAM/selenodomain-associated transferase 2 [Rhodobacteraceae bacterium MBR-64]